MRTQASTSVSNHGQASSQPHRWEHMRSYACWFRKWPWCYLVLTSIQHLKATPYWLRRWHWRWRHCQPLSTSGDSSHSPGSRHALVGHLGAATCHPDPTGVPWRSTNDHLIPPGNAWCMDKDPTYIHQHCCHNQLPRLLVWAASHTPDTSPTPVYIYMDIQI